MAILKYGKAVKGKALVGYLLKGEARYKHAGVDERVLGLASQNVDVDGDWRYIAGQFDALRYLSGKEKKRKEVHHLIVSYGKDELNANDPDDVLRATELSNKTAQAIGGKDSQYLVVMQADNENGLLHGHIVMNSVLMNSKVMPTNRVTVSKMRNTHDKVLLENGHVQPAILMADSGTSLGRETLEEKALKTKGVHTNKDMTRERVELAVKLSKNEDDFADNLGLLGIELKRGKRKGEPVYKYVLDGEKKAMTDRALGESVSYETIQRQIEANRESGLTPAETMSKATKRLRDEKRFNEYAKMYGVSEYVRDTPKNDDLGRDSEEVAEMAEESLNELKTQNKGLNEDSFGEALAEYQESLDDEPFALDDGWPDEWAKILAEEPTVFVEPAKKKKHKEHEEVDEVAKRVALDEFMANEYNEHLLAQEDLRNEIAAQKHNKELGDELEM